MRRGCWSLQMKPGNILRVANYGKGQTRWRSRRLLTMSIGAVCAHLVARTEHLCTHCAGSCSGKMPIFNMSFYRCLYPFLTIGTFSTTTWYTFRTKIRWQNSNCISVAAEWEDEVASLYPLVDVRARAGTPTPPPAWCQCRKEPSRCGKTRSWVWWLPVEWARGFGRINWKKMVMMSYQTSRLHMKLH